MAISTTQLIRDRKNWLRKFRPTVRETVSAAKGLLRELDRVIKRRRSLPEEDDLIRFLKLADSIATENQDTVIELSKGFPQ